MDEIKTGPGALSDWVNCEPAVDVSVIMKLDSMVKKLRDLDTEIEVISSQKKELDKEYAALELAIVEMLKLIDKDEYSVKNVAKIKLMHRLSVQTPKTNADKRAFLKYIHQKYGEETAEKYVSINSQTLNSFYKAEFEIAEDKADFKIDGIGAPVVTEYIRCFK